MIARDSKSYPYLAIAQHYNVPYAEVLEFADDMCEIKHKLDIFYSADAWKMKVWELENDAVQQ